MLNCFTNESNNQKTWNLFEIEMCFKQIFALFLENYRILEPYSITIFLLEMIKHWNLVVFFLLKNKERSLSSNHIIKNNILFYSLKSFVCKNVEFNLILSKLTKIKSSKLRRRKNKTKNSHPNPPPDPFQNK